MDKDDIVSATFDKAKMTFAFVIITSSILLTYLSFFTEASSAALLSFSYPLLRI
jgi:hypothetical protein